MLAELCEQGQLRRGGARDPTRQALRDRRRSCPFAPGARPASRRCRPSLTNHCPGSVAAWSLASKLALDLIAREKSRACVRTRRGARAEARWAVALASAEDAARVTALARSMPPAAHSVSLANASNEVWAPEALLVAFSRCGGRCRSSGRKTARDRKTRPVSPPAGRRPQTRPTYQPWEQRWLEALGSSAQHFAPEGFLERSVADDLQRWSEPAIVCARQAARMLPSRAAAR